MHLVGSLVGEGQYRATARVQHRLPGAKTAQVEARTATYFLLVSAAMDQSTTASCSQTVQIMASGLRSLQVGLRILINARDPAHDFTMKLSLAMCSHSNCLGWRKVTACDL